MRKCVQIFSECANISWQRLFPLCKQLKIWPRECAAVKLSLLKFIALEQLQSYSLIDHTDQAISNQLDFVINEKVCKLARTWYFSTCSNNAHNLNGKMKLNQKKSILGPIIAWLDQSAVPVCKQSNLRSWSISFLRRTTPRAENWMLIGFSLESSVIQSDQKRIKNSSNHARES